MLGLRLPVGDEGDGGQPVGRLLFFLAAAGKVSPSGAFCFSWPQPEMSSVNAAASRTLKPRIAPSEKESRPADLAR